MKVQLVVIDAFADRQVCHRWEMSLNNRIARNGRMDEGRKNSNKIQNRMGNSADGKVGVETRQAGWSDGERGTTGREGLVRQRQKEESGAWFEG